jgi:ABC-type multidrug transport system permease subunit
MIRFGKRPRAPTFPLRRGDPANPRPAVLVENLDPGVLIGSLIRAEDKVTGLCVLASLVMAALGGCWWPLEVVPDFAKTLAHTVPTGWALDALHQLITFGAGLETAVRPLAVLAFCAIGANLAAMKWFRA